MPIYAFVLAGLASWYDLPGNIMANGQPFDSTKHTCAMRAEPFGERVEIVNTENGKSSWCIVTDRGPAQWTGHDIDTAPPVRDELGLYEPGVAQVLVYKVVGHLSRCKIFPRPQTCSTPPRECVLDLPKPAILDCSSHH